MSIVPTAATIAAPPHCYYSKAKVAELLKLTVYHVGLLAEAGELDVISVGRRNYITSGSVTRFKQLATAPTHD